jgi:hypothetical protein
MCLEIQQNCDAKGNETHILMCSTSMYFKQQTTLNPKFGGDIGQRPKQEKPVGGN